MPGCEVEGCNSVRIKRVWCSKHYQRWRRYGSPLYTKTGPTLEERFWPKVDKQGRDDCWEWVAGRDVGGYGRISVDKVPQPAYRVSYQINIGPIPEGMVIDHMCHNPPCVNPTHLRAITQKQNGEHRAGLNKNNTSGVRGVSWSKVASKWMVQITHNRKWYYGGLYSEIEDARVAAENLQGRLFSHSVPVA